MSFFGLGGVTFDDQNRERTIQGPLAALMGTEFRRNTYQYPIDAGSYDKGHYVVFFIRTQKESQYPGTTIAEDSPDVKIINEGNKSFLDQAVGKTNTNIISQFSNQITQGVNNAIKGGVGALTSKLAPSISNPINKAFGTGAAKQKDSEATAQSLEKIVGKNAAFKETTQLTTDTIALYMPDTINFDSSQAYDELKSGYELSGQLAAALPSLVERFGKGGVSSNEAISAAFKSGIGRVVMENFVAKSKLIGKDTGKGALYGAFGKVLNPMLEMIYTAPKLRTFQFEFFFYPRSKAEAEEVQKIIRRFRFHQAPELSKIGGYNDGLLIPPSQFDVKFYYGAYQNPNIPPIAKSCVLENIQINYAPNGWSTYEVPGENIPTVGGTGMPVGIQMTLQFKETTYITKQDFNANEFIV